jgi:four helix bundle protein
MIELNGATAHLGKAGDLLTIMNFAQLTPDESKKHKPRIAVLDRQNRIVRCESCETPNSRREWEKEVTCDRWRVRGCLIKTGMETKPQNYQDLVVWQKGIQLAKLIYQITRSFPSEEKFGLIAQMRRAAVSIPSNVAEGQARRTTGEFIQFISHAEGSAAELDTQIILAVELSFCRKTDVLSIYELNDEIRRMLNALRRKLAERAN